jgi:hypothetical protein
MNVVSVAPHPNTEKNWRHVTLEENGNRQRAVCFSGTAADELKPGPLPSDWRVKQGEHRPILEPPKKPGGVGGGGFRNSEAAVRLEQNRLDARMAVQLASRDGNFNRSMAEQVLGWLKAAR